MKWFKGKLAAVSGELHPINQALSLLNDGHLPLIQSTSVSLDRTHLSDFRLEYWQREAEGHREKMNKAKLKVEAKAGNLISFDELDCSSPIS